MEEKGVTAIVLPGRLSPFYEWLDLHSFAIWLRRSFEETFLSRPFWGEGTTMVSGELILE